VRQNIVTRVDSSTRQERGKALKSVGLQALAAIIVALLWLTFKSPHSAVAALLGGGACVIPSFLFTWALFALISPRAVKRVAIAFGVGEFVKLLVSSLALGLTIVLMPTEMFPVLAGFMGAQFGFWLAPLLNGKSNRR